MTKVVYSFPLLVFMFLCLVSYSQTTENVGPVPGIQFESQKIDVGNVLYKKDSTYVYMFFYENTGDAPLIVNQVRGHCPCLDIHYSVNPLPPGQRDTIVVRFTPSHASKYTQRLSVFTNSPRSGILLYLKGNFLKRSDYMSVMEESSNPIL